MSTRRSPNNVKEITIDEKEWEIFPKEEEEKVLKVKNTLVNLTIDNCPNLRELPESFSKLSKLNQLTIDDCPNLGEIPESFSQLSKLNQLTINKTNISSLPNSFSNLKELKDLSLIYNNFEELPSLTILSRLEKLTIFEEIENLSNIYKINTLKTLYFGGEKITSISSEISNLNDLNYLTIERTLITKLPSSITSLSKLEILMITDTPLKELPDDIGKLTNLTEVYINIDDGNLKLPESFGDLSKLKVLELNNIGLTKIPDFFRNFKNIISLYLPNNKLTKIPSFISEYKDLETLDITNNLLESLPQSICDLREDDNFEINEEGNPGFNEYNLLPCEIEEEEDEEIDIVECQNEDDPFYIEDFTKGADEYRERDRVIILEESSKRNGTCYERNSLIKALFSYDKSPMGGPYPKNTNRYFKLAHNGVWIDLKGVKLILQGVKILKMKKVKVEKIGTVGTQFEISRTHGVEEQIYTLVKVNSKYQGMNTPSYKIGLNKNLTVNYVGIGDYIEFK